MSERLLGLLAQGQSVDLYFVKKGHAVEVRRCGLSQVDGENSTVAPTIF